MEREGEGSTEEEGVRNEISKEDVKPAAGASSIEERCPICLEDFQDMAFVDACFHTFCFSCVVRWAETTTTSCPLCKTAFSKVIHNVRANDDYDVFKVVPKPINLSAGMEVVDLDEALRSFRGYRTTRYPGQPPENRPVVRPPTSAPSVRPRPFRQHRAHRRDSRKPASVQRRRAVYSTGVRALPLRSGSRPVKVRDISASFYCSNPAATHRLYPWLNRELEVLVGREHVEFITQIITSLLDKVNIQSDEFPSYLEPYLHERTAHFMHELISFASSPYDMIAYDQNVAYNWPSGHPEHTSGGEPSEPRETGTATQGLGGSELQQRIFDELSSTGWDDSPPILETVTPGYLNHSSDSEYVGSENEAEVAASRQRVSVVIIDNDEQPSGAGVNDQQSTVVGGPGVDVQTKQWVDKESNVGVISETRDSHSVIAAPGAITETMEVNEGGTPFEVVDLTVNKGTSDATSQPQASQSQSETCDVKNETSTDYEIQLFAESESECIIDNEPEEHYTVKQLVGKDKNSSDCDLGKRKKTKHKKKHDKDRRNSERGHSSKLSRERTIRDRSGSKRHSPDISTSRHKHSRHRHTQRRSSASVEYSRHRDQYHQYYRDSPERSSRDNAFYRRNRSHRSKLYSDDISDDDERSKLDTNGKYSFNKKNGSYQFNSVEVSSSLDAGKSYQTLSSELNGLEQQISDNKRDLLKSMLRRERIEFLRNTLHPQSCPKQPDPLPVKSSLVNGVTSVRDMQTELQSLETAIVDGKKNLLRVMKRIEEDQKDNDSN